MPLNRHNAALASTRLYEAETSIELLAARYDLDATEMIDFSLNVNPFGPPKSAIEAAAATLAGANYYPDLNYSALRAAVAMRHGIGGGNIVFGAGLDDVIKLLLHAWTSEGDGVLVHLPTFPRYALEARLRGCRVVGVPSIPAENTDIGRLDAALRHEPVALAFICTPNNPTGEQIPTEAIEDLAVAHGDTLFVVDEALINPLCQGAMGLPARRRNVIVLRTLSKFYGLAGLRIGYAVGDAHLIAVAGVGRPPFNVALPSLAAAVAAIGDTAFLEHCTRVFAEESANFRAEVATIPGIAVRGCHANMVLLDVKNHTAAAAAAALARRGIVVADATSFEGLENSATLRVSLRTRAENERLVAALRGI